MTSIMMNRTYDRFPGNISRNVRAMFRTLFSAHREIQSVLDHARREQRALGFQNVPQRVWDRRSALFVASVHRRDGESR